MVSFEELGLNMSIVKAVKEIGMENPFPIQEHCIPLILKGKDVIGQAHTGTGKTAAFSLPLINSLKSRGPIQALVLVPTRELAMQVTTEIRKFSKYMGIRSLAVYGGQSINIQKEQLKKGSANYCGNTWQTNRSFETRNDSIRRCKVCSVR